LIDPLCFLINRQPGEELEHVCISDDFKLGRCDVGAHDGFSMCYPTPIRVVKIGMGLPTLRAIEIS